MTFRAGNVVSMTSIMNPPRFFSFNRYLRERFGARVHKVSIDAGFTCPNIDGLKGTGGCTYCNNSGFSFNTRVGSTAVREQVDSGIRAMRERFKAERFIAYFQAFSNTYAPVDHLKRLYDAAVERDEVTALAVGTRSDCVSPAVMDLLGSYTDRKEVWIEYGLQTVHDRTLERVNRCERYADFERAIELASGRNIKVCVHLILGLPGETQDDMLTTAARLRNIPHHSLKLHILHVMRDTRMATEFARGEIQLQTRQEYVDTVVRMLERIRPDVSIQRMTADAPLQILIAPMWCLDKNGIRLQIVRELERRDTWQGKALGYSLDAIGVCQPEPLAVSA